ncbi:MAG: GNAT family acetyltransferase [Chloroflexota bacterium]
MSGAASPVAWRVRPFDMGDYEAVYALWRAAGAGVSLRPSDRRDEVAKKLLRDPELFLVAELEGRVVGVIMGAWDGRRGWLHHLAVDAACRGQGIATVLIAAVEEALRSKGCLKVNLLVGARNERARRLYASLGYAEMTDFVAMGKEL